MNSTTDIICVEGCHALSGSIDVQGAKNSVLKLMAASILAPGSTTITNAPLISDVLLMGEVLKCLGAKVSYGQGEIRIDSSTIDSHYAPYELVSQMRASIAVLGPLLGRFGSAVVAMPGGCNLGARQIDMHFSALEALGVEFSTAAGNIVATAPQGLHGASVHLSFPSVGATENVMMAAVCAKGTTIVENAAREPEISDLGEYLGEMGAKIVGLGSPIIRIEGTDKLYPVACHKTIGDRIEAGTFLVAGALMGGPLTVRGVRPAQLECALLKLEDMGVSVTRGDDSITVARLRPLIATDIQTLPFPGFPTDLQPQFMVLCALADGKSTIAENIFENRFVFTEEFARMGADVVVHGHFAQLQGVSGLSAVPVKAPDLRGGAALVLAGLAAEGYTKVSEVVHIDRGYEGFTDKLASLGAKIRRQPLEDA
ncbi:MAG: UDP-N-acetylglucosamine 1-carboxyvinyltransferase [Actinomycetia bacterium]|nr:UDP-N-acetylglucosamine 1-carboxyvinyltransferase [Actinomycetes bacterium]